MKIPAALTLAVAKPMRKLIMRIKKDDRLLNRKTAAQIPREVLFVDWRLWFRYKSASGGIYLIDISIVSALIKK